MLSTKVAGQEGEGGPSDPGLGAPGGEAVIFHPGARSHSCRWERDRRGGLLEKPRGGAKTSTMWLCGGGIPRALRPFLPLHPHPLKYEAAAHGEFRRES